MRVESSFELGETAAKLEFPPAGSGEPGTYFDLRESPALVERLESARRHPPLRTFLDAVNSADSLFATCGSKLGSSEENPSAGEPCIFTSRVDLVFVPDSFNLDRAHYEDLVQKLSELLAREPGPDTQRAELRVHPCRFPGTAGWGYAMRIVLSGRGISAGQAEVRWGLALARLQQALLFSSRLIRQRIAQTS